MVILDHTHLDLLLDALKKKGYNIIGPTKRGVSIVLEEIHTSADFPVNTQDEQQPGVYRLRMRNDQAYFGFSAGPQSWKKFLFPSTLSLMKIQRAGKSFEFSVPMNGGQIAGNSEQPPKMAFFGMHACDLHALQIHDKVLSGGEYADPYYKKMRERLFIVAVNCIEAGGTCFCTSMGTGPRATAGFDLALTEHISGDEHYFVIETGSKNGEKILEGLPHRPAGKGVREEVEKTIQRVSRHMGRALETKGLKEKLHENFEHPRWDEVAKRCLACANCTLVCPTCFCSTVEDVTDLSGTNAERVRTWDSCFTHEFSYIHGGSVRPTIRARYRQWLTHKLSNWIDQFGTSGCVGCGRCITWCPVGIDITEEAGAICRAAARSSTTS
jgi:sulfhydrogenase subunit beta (sulfur reductase)